MRSPLARFALEGLLALSLTAVASAQGVRIVDQPGLGTFTDIQQAVDAAVDGDTLLIASGTYAPFTIDDKGIALVAVPGADVQVEGTVEIRNLSAGETLLVSGLNATGEVAEFASAPGLRVQSSAGHVRIQSCTFRGGFGFPAAYPGGGGGRGAQVSQSDRVAFADCTLIGGEGFGHDPQCYDCTGGDGGSGLTVASSAVALYDCDVRGGDAGDSGAFGGDGGDGARANSDSVFASGCNFQGGEGGDADDFVFAVGGDGGDGLVVLAQATARLLDDTFTGGAGGIAIVFPGNEGQNGQGLVNGGGAVTQYPGAARSLTADVAHGDAASAVVHFEGELGDRVFVIVSRTPAFAFSPGLTGQALVPFPFFGRNVPHGVVGATGELDLQLPLPDIADADARLYLQGLVFDSQGSGVLAGPLHLVLLDRQGLPDCDGNGTSDYVDVVEGTDPDCNTNLTPDSCDIAAGASLDCNGNGVPDECDLASGTSTDLNDNGIPDDCEGGMTWFVDAAAPFGGDGSEANPFKTLRDAVTPSVDGDTIVALDGTYTGGGNREIDFGGRNITVRSLNGPQNCIIDCQLLGRAFRMTSGETDARIEGFTIRNGDAINNYTRGGGVFVMNASATIQDCRFQNCHGFGGGGVYASGTVRVLECIFTGCHVSNLSDGGAIELYLPPSLPHGAFSIVRNTVISGCTAGRGGAISAYGERGLFVSHCTLFDNTAAMRGGAIHASCVVADPLDEGFFMTDSRLFGNTSLEHGGGLALYESGTVATVVNSTFTDNDASLSGGALYVSAPNLTTPGVASLASSILWANNSPAGDQIALSGVQMTLHVNYSDVQGGQGQVDVTGSSVLDWGAGNISADPLFNGPHLFLLPGSPCIDAGDNGAILADRADVDEDGDTAEAVPLDVAFGPRRTDDPQATDTGNGAAPVVDMGAVEKQ